MKFSLSYLALVWVAPILYHMPLDCFLLSLFATLMELTDTFAGYRTLLFFIFSALLLKNQLLVVLKKSIANFVESKPYVFFKGLASKSGKLQTVFSFFKGFFKKKP